MNFKIQACGLFMVLTASLGLAGQEKQAPPSTAE
jgi:hypothetical protein